MRTLLVHAHPLEESLSAALRDRAVLALRDGANQVRVVRIGHGGEPGPGREELVGVTALVLVYPTWWGSQPAPLLDWIQRTLEPWVDGREAGPSPLRSVVHLVAVTTHGSSRFVNRLQGEPGRRLLERSVLPQCAPGADLRWVALYKLDRLDQGAIDAFVGRVGTELAELGELTGPEVTSAPTSA